MYVFMTSIFSNCFILAHISTKISDTISSADSFDFTMEYEKVFKGRKNEKIISYMLQHRHTLQLFAAVL